MTVGELKEKLDKAKVKDSDDVTVVCGHKYHAVIYAKHSNWPMRRGLFTPKIFEIVCK